MTPIEKYGWTWGEWKTNLDMAAMLGGIRLNGFQARSIKDADYLEKCLQGAL